MSFGVKITDVFRPGRERAFMERHMKMAVEDLQIATLLLCRCELKRGGKTVAEYPAGKFCGTEYGKLTTTGEPIFLFLIDGDIAEFHQRRNLFHSAALRVDPLEWNSKRNFLLDALTYAKQEFKCKLKASEVLGDE